MHAKISVAPIVTKTPRIWVGSEGKTERRDSTHCGGAVDAIYADTKAKGNNDDGYPLLPVKFTF